MASDERLKYLLEELETQATKVESHVKEIKSLLPNSTDNFKQQFDKISDKIKYTLTNNNTVDYSTGRELAKYDIKSNNAQVANSLTGKGIASKYNISNAGPTSSFKPTLTADQVKANFERVQWYPQTFKQFIKHPFDVKKGVDINDVIANIGTIVKFHPQSLFIQIWNSLYSIGIIIYIMLMPLGICYINFQEWSPALTVYITSLIVVKTVVTVNTGIIADQELEMDRSIVWRHLWKQKYLLKQLLIGFPYSFLIDLIAPPGSMSRFVWRALSLINGLSIVQLLQSTDVSYLSEKATQVIRKREINPTMVKFVYILVAIIFYWHYFSCAITFANVTGFIPDPIVKSNFYDHYVFNFYNSASLMFTAGFGVNGPVENQDRWSKILNMIFSAFLLSLFTANITTYMIRLDSSGRQFNEKLEEVNQYIQYRGLGRGLQERIIQYYHFKYSKGKYFDEDKILAELNHPLRVSICMKECRGLILQVPFFRDASHSFLTQVVTILEICHFLADDVIIEEGTVGDQMFFISSGIVEVLIGEKPVKRLNEGEYFGEISLLFGNMNRTASIKAITDCVLFSVVVSDFKEIVEDFPEILNQMKIVAEARLKENKIGVKLTGNRTAVLVDRSYEALNEEFEQKPLQKASDKLHRSIEDLKDNSAVLPLIKSEYIHSNIVVINQNNENLEAFPSTDGNVIDIEKRKEETTPKSPIIFESNLDQVFNDRKLKNSASDFINLNFLDKHISDPTSPPNNNTNDPTAISSSEVPNDNEVRRRAEDSIMSDNTQKNAEFRIERPVGRGESIKPRNRGATISATKLKKLESTTSPITFDLPSPTKFMQEVPSVPNQSVKFASEKDDTTSQPNSDRPIQTRLRSKSVSVKKNNLLETQSTPDQPYPLSPLTRDEKTKSIDRFKSPLVIPSNTHFNPAVSNASMNKSQQLQKEQRKSILKSNASLTDSIDIQVDSSTKANIQRKKDDMKSRKLQTIADAAKPAKRTWYQDLDFLWNKYKPSTTYCPLTPQLPFTKIWNSIIDVILCVIVILLPIPFGFASMEYMLPQLSIVNLIISILDLMVKLQTGHLHHQEIEMEPKKLISIYSRDGTFLFDFLTGFPWVFVIDAITTNDHTLRVWLRIICIINGCAIIRSLTARDRYSYLSEALTDYIRKYDINSSAVQAGKIVLVMAFYWHWRSCMYNLLVRNGAIPNVNPDYFDFDNFTIHFFNSATEMLNAGCGATQPKVNVDRWATVVNFIFNVTLMSLFVGNVSSFMIGLDSSGRQFNEQLEQVTQYITYKGLGRELKSKILAYYQLKYSKGKYFDEAKILSELNHPLRLAIYMRECRALIIQVPFFKGADNGFISQVVMILKPAHFLPDDIIIEKGTVGNLMYFISSGTLDVIIDGNKVATLSPGQFFGEIALLFGNMKRTATIKAVTSCTLYSLSRTDLGFILEVYPEMAEKMQKIAEERIAKNRNLNAK